MCLPSLAIQLHCIISLAFTQRKTTNFFIEGQIQRQILFVFEKFSINSEWYFFTWIADAANGSGMVEMLLHCSHHYHHQTTKSFLFLFRYVVGIMEIAFEEFFVSFESEQKENHFNSVWRWRKSFPVMLISWANG